MAQRKKSTARKRGRRKAARQKPGTATKRPTRPSAVAKGPTPPTPIARRAAKPPTNDAVKFPDEAPVVTIFGAGITGLSVAHELIERGFTVQVVEKERQPDREYECEVGGMACNQFGRIRADITRLHPYLFDERKESAEYLASVPKEIDDPKALPRAGDPEARRCIEVLRRLRRARMQPIQKRFPIPQRIRFKQDHDTLDLAMCDEYLHTNREKLEVVAKTLRDAVHQYTSDLEAEVGEAHLKDEWDSLEARVRQREILLVEIRGHTDADGEPGTNRRLGLKRARAVKQYLIGALGDLPEIKFHLVALGLGSEQPEGPPRLERVRERSNRVDFQIVEQVLPGEHGYRFFPAYYRHLFDTMKRTPILDREQQETGRTAINQLVVPPPVAIDLEDTKHFLSVGRQLPRSLEGFREMLKVFLDDMELTERDMHRYHVQLLKFMTSCEGRRHQLEELSWLDFMDGKRELLKGEKPPPGGKTVKPDAAPPTGYSEKAERLLRKTSQALIAMDAAETDAHTHGLTSVQLLLDYLEVQPRTDMTLDAPTSVAWLYHWKSYLKRQGVRFFLGRIKELAFHGEELVPVVWGPEPKAEDGPLAEDGCGAFISHESKGGGLTTDFYVLALPFGVACDLVRDLPENRLQGDLRQLRNFGRESGYFDGLTRDETGHPQWNYPFRDLSGIQYYFTHQVRIGSGHMVYPHSPWGLSSISQQTHWRERRSREGGYLGLLSVDIGDWYEEDPKRNGRTAWNSTLYQIASGVWDQIARAFHPDLTHEVARPNYYHLDEYIELDKKDPHDAKPIKNHSPFLINLPGHWKHRPGQDRRGRGERSDRHEDATKIPNCSESIRYDVAHDRWVLAGTHMATLTRLATMESANESARHAVITILEQLGKARRNSPLYNGAGTVWGSRPDVWDPAAAEIDDLKPLKRLDELLFDQGLPHFLDILRIPELIDKLPKREKKTADRPITNFLKLLEGAGRTYSKDWEFATNVPDDIARAVRELITKLSGPEGEEALRRLAELFSSG